VPQRPVIEGESFQVQYILENAENNPDFTFPKFSGLRLVTGPNVYSGKKLAANNQAILYKNVVFTLAALNTGKFKIPGASCQVNGKILKSNDVFIKIISAKGSDESSYFLKPGEDAMKKIRENLFLRLTVDKQTCFIGEPLVATFKLYSRLQSKSNIIKNPGFYGFSVYDMIEVNDKVQSEEKLKGHWFDVHTVRKVQLYPLEAGVFTIDAMELENEVEFSQNEINKKTKQAVSENMYNKNADKENSTDAKMYEMNIRSEPVVINVRPLPGKNPADTFAGAVGSFAINAFVSKDSVLKNEEDSLNVEINGAGNFQRVNAPIINWPGSFEVFEPSVKDTFDKQQVPLAGQRKFKYIFVSDHPGFYTIPSVSFSFFNLKTKTYKTVSTKPFTIFVSAKTKNRRSSGVLPVPLKSNSNSNWLLIGLAFFALATGIIMWAIKRRKKDKIENQRRAYEPPVKSLLSVQEILTPARTVLNHDDKTFYDALGRCIWNYFNDRFSNSNPRMIKKELSGILMTKGIDQEKINKLLEIIHQCEIGMYTNAEMGLDKKELFENTQNILSDIESYG